MSTEPNGRNGAFRIKWGPLELEGRGRDVVLILVIVTLVGTLGVGWYIHHQDSNMKLDAILANQSAIIQQFKEVAAQQREGDAGIIYILSRSVEEREKLNLQEPDAVRRLRR